MGYKEVEEWTAHENNFSSLLENLNGTQNTPVEEDSIKLTSLQAKVENSRARINYHKFIKAKDLSRCSEKELANIFGRKSLQKPANTENFENVEEIVEPCESNDLLVNKGSMLDYFRGKLLNRGKGNLEKRTKDESESENERVGFGFNANSNNNITEDGDDGARKVKKKKRKIMSENVDSGEKDEENERVGKKKKRKHLDIAIDDNSDNAVCSTKKKKRKHVDAAIIENIEAAEEHYRKKKEKLVKTDQNLDEINETIEEIEGESQEIEIEVVKKPKKSKKQKNSTDDFGGINNLGFTDNMDPQPEIIPKKKKKKKRECHEISEEGIDNPTFHSKEDTSNKPLDCLSPYEVKPKKKKRSKRTEIGLDNPSLNLSEVIADGELMLNVTNTPIVATPPVKQQKFQPDDLNIERVRHNRRKSVRFNDVLEEHIIPNDPSERSNEYITNRNELFDINTMVIEEGIKEEMEKNGVEYRIRRSTDLDSIDPKELNRKVVESSVKEELNRGLNPQTGFVNNGFDIRSVDRINFCNDKFELKPQANHNTNGIDNKGFNPRRVEIEENVNAISDRIERCQAEVENDINECKSASNKARCVVGDVGTQISENVRVEEGLKLCFKQMRFRTAIPHYLKGPGVNEAKRSYRHLIRGDITVTFRNSNLHAINGYATQNNANTM